MKCIRCNADVPDTIEFCTTCGANMLINYRTKLIADNLYNKGLQMAAEHRLTEAADSLRKALCFDRFNCDARNVLGLIYFEIGQVADALKQWAISSSYVKKNNLATTYLTQVKNSPTEMEHMNEAVKMYNSALTSLLKKDKDVGIVQLKKAVELNPKLVEARNLLSAYYITQHDNSNAQELLDSVVQVDKTNAKAIVYRDSAAPSGANTPSKSLSLGDDSYDKVVSIPFIKNKKFSKNEIRNMIIGAVCALCVMLLLVIPISLISGNQFSKTKVNLAESTKKYQTEDAKKSETIKKLTAERDQANAQNKKLTTQLDVAVKIQKLNKAESLEKDGQLRDAANLLTSINSEGLDEGNKARYEELRDSVVPDAAVAVFNEGRQLYSNGTYDQAKESFEVALKFGMSDRYTGDAYYYLGRIEENAGNTDAAKAHYQKVVNDYSSESTMVSTARSRLSNLE